MVAMVVELIYNRTDDWYSGLIVLALYYKSEGNTARLHLALFYPFLFTMLALLIPNTTDNCPITYTTNAEKYLV